MANQPKMNPFMAYFYMTYLELYLLENPLSVKRYDSYFGAMDMPPQIRRLCYVAKHRAKYCNNRAKILRKLYALQYTDGYKTVPTKTDKFAYFESLDPLGKTLTQNTLLFKEKNEERGF